MKFVYLVLGVFGVASLVIACGSMRPAPSSGIDSPQAAEVATEAQPGEESIAPLVTCDPQTEHLCHISCGGSYCEADGVDCAFCEIVNKICECQ